MNHMTIDGKTPFDDELPDKEIEVTIFLSISKTVKVTVPQQSDYSLYKAVEEQITLPHDLATFTERMFEHDLDLKATKMPKYLKDSIEGCKGWNVDDFEIFEE